MKTSTAIIAACAGAFVFAQAGPVQAQERLRGGFIIPLVAKSDSGKPGQAGQASGKRVHSGAESEGRMISPRDVPRRRTAAPGKPNQAGTTISASRSNIKQ
jgi:hypothetical protein